MGLPNRLNLVDIVIRQILLDRTLSPVDEFFQEPQVVMNYADPITLQGQVNFGTRMFNAMLATLTGSENRTRGHLVFRVADLQTAGVTIQNGDLVTSIAGVACNLQIREPRYESPLDGGFLLLYAMLENNKEVSASN